MKERNIIFPEFFLLVVAGSHVHGMPLFVAAYRTSAAHRPPKNDNRMDRDLLKKIGEPVQYGKQNELGRKNRVKFKFRLELKKSGLDPIFADY